MSGILIDELENMESVAGDLEDTRMCRELDEMSRMLGLQHQTAANPSEFAAHARRVTARREATERLRREFNTAYENFVTAMEAREKARHQKKMKQVHLELTEAVASRQERRERHERAMEELPEAVLQRIQRMQLQRKQSVLKAVRLIWETRRMAALGRSTALQDSAVNKLQQACNTKLKFVQKSLVELVNRDELISLQNLDLNEKVIAGELTYAEFIAIADAINQNVESNKGDPMSFLTTSNWSAPTNVFVLLLTLAHLHRQRSMETLGAEAYLNIALQTTTTGASLATFIDTLSRPASGLQTVCQVVAGGAGGAAGFLQFVSELRNYDTLRTIGQRLDKLYERYPFDRSTIMARAEPIDFFVKKIRQKLGHREMRSRVGMAAGVAGAGQGTLTSLAVAGIATGAAIPVIGWALLGLTSVGGLGALGYAAHRRKHKQAKLRQLRDTHPELEIPVWISTTGELYRYWLGDFIFRAVAVNDFLFSEDMIGMGHAFGWVLFGENYAVEVRQEGILGIMAFLKG